MNTQRRHAPGGGFCSSRPQKPQSWSSALSGEPLKDIIRSSRILGFNKPANAASDLGAECFIVLRNLRVLRRKKSRKVALGAHHGRDCFGDALRRLRIAPVQGRFSTVQQAAQSAGRMRKLRLI
jgi:hypothetical protein